MMASPVIITMYIFQPEKEKGGKKKKTQEMGLTHFLSISIVSKVTNALFPSVLYLLSKLYLSKNQTYKCGFYFDWQCAQIQMSM